MRPNEKGDVSRLDVLQLNVRETSCCEVFPRSPGDHASVAEKEPHAFEHVLEEESPARRIGNDVFQKVEGASLWGGAKIERIWSWNFDTPPPPSSFSK